MSEPTECLSEHEMELATKLLNEILNLANSSAIDAKNRRFVRNSLPLNPGRATLFKRVFEVAGVKR